jgi:hypothetical protein
MVFDASVALTWIMFLALFPMAFLWLRRAWRITARHDFSEVALKRGESPEQPSRFAPFTAAINLVCGIVMVFVIVGVIGGGIDFDTWSAMAGITIWGKFFGDFILSRHAHPMVHRKKA